MEPLSCEYLVGAPATCLIDDEQIALLDRVLGMLILL
jgi:hypothetical protein